MTRHKFKLEHTDRLGRRWCVVCQLPENNARARQMHSAPTLPSRPRAEDWRDRAYRQRDF